MITPEREAEMMAEREEMLKGDPNANNAEKGEVNAALEKEQWASESQEAEKLQKSQPDNTETQVDMTSTTTAGRRVSGTSNPRDIPSPTTPSSPVPSTPSSEGSASTPPTNSSGNE